MLQAVIHNKIGNAISDGKIKFIEDTLTSSVIGLMQYLPDDLFWVLLRGACGISTEGMPDSIGTIIGFHFWEHFDPTGTRNTNHVEPDVWVETDKYDILIEAKRSDGIVDNAQSSAQWKDQIIAFRNDYGDEMQKSLIYIAIGGNESLNDVYIQMGNEKIPIHTASWFDLLNSIQKELNCRNTVSQTSHTQRLLLDIVNAFQIHNIVRTVWLDSLPIQSIQNNSFNELRRIWSFDNSLLLSSIKQYKINHIKDLRNIWTIK